MYNNNNLCSKYSFSQKTLPSFNPLFTTQNYHYNYCNEQNPINKPKRQFDDNEINKIIENCKNNLKRLQNIYVSNNTKNFPSHNNNIIYNDYNNNYINVKKKYKKL